LPDRRDLGGGADHARLVRHPQSPDTSSATTWGWTTTALTPRALFGQAFAQNDASQYFSRLAP
jgi:hypothetical protein